MGIFAPVRDMGRSRLLALGAGLALLICAAPYASAQTFTVGGSISNLTGSGLVLQLDVQPPACIANFSLAVGMSTALEPAGQACTRATAKCCSNSSVNNMDSTDVNGTHTCTVTCGSVIGVLPGSISVAASTQTVSPPAAATSYVFPDSIDDGSPYTVSIITQPSNPAQVCTVANPTGTVSGANVTNANVTCATVVHTVTATAGPNGSASPPSQNINDGATGIVTLAPATGFIGSATGCGGSLGGDGVTYTTGVVTADCTVTATFTALPQIPASPSPTMSGLALALLAIAFVILAWRWRRKVQSP